MLAQSPEDHIEAPQVDPSCTRDLCAAGAEGGFLSRRTVPPRGLSLRCLRWQLSSQNAFSPTRSRVWETSDGGALVRFCHHKAEAPINGDLRVRWGFSAQRSYPAASDCSPPREPIWVQALLALGWNGRGAYLGDVASGCHSDHARTIRTALVCGSRW